MINNKDTKTITLTYEEYAGLLDDSEFLDALQACGVDNWEGYCDWKSADVEAPRTKTEILKELENE